MNSGPFHKVLLVVALLALPLVSPGALATPEGLRVSILGPERPEPLQRGEESPGYCLERIRLGLDCPSSVTVVASAQPECKDMPDVALDCTIDREKLDLAVRHGPGWCAAMDANDRRMHWFECDVLVPAALSVAAGGLPDCTRPSGPLDPALDAAVCTVWVAEDDEGDPAGPEDDKLPGLLAPDTQPVGWAATLAGPDA